MPAKKPGNKRKSKKEMQAKAALMREAKRAKRAREGPRTKLTDREEAFVQRYLIHMNASRAMREAGYTGEYISQAAWKILHSPEYKRVQDAIDKAKAERAERYKIEEKAVLGELAKVAFANMTDYIDVRSDGDATIDLRHIDYDKAAAIQEMTVETYTERDAEGKPKTVKRVKFKLADKVRPLELLGKHLRTFIDRSENTNTLRNPDGTPLIPSKVEIVFEDPSYGNEEGSGTEEAAAPAEKDK